MRSFQYRFECTQMGWLSDAFQQDVLIYPLLHEMAKHCNLYINLQQKQHV